MRRAALVLVLVALTARAEEEPEALELPACLREGTRAAFVRKAGSDAPKLSGEYSTLPTSSGESVQLLLDEKSGDLGPLTLHRQASLLLRITTGRVSGCSHAESRDPRAGPRQAWRLDPDPEKEGRLLLKRYEYDEKGEVKERTSKLAAPAGLWTPDILEPFVAAQLRPEIGETAELRIFDTERLRFSSRPVVYRRLGEGMRKVGDEEVGCSIWRRERGEEKTLVFRRLSDGMPLRDEAARLRIREPEEREDEEEGR